MSTASTNIKQSQRWPGLTSNQLYWLVLQGSALGGLTVWQFLTNFEEFTRFVADPAGRKLACSAAMLATVNFAVLLAGWLTLNRLSTSILQTRVLARRLLAGLLSVGCFLWCYLPAFFIVVIGPAAVNIRATMMAP
jgi:hypothetical protein